MKLGRNGDWNLIKITKEQFESMSKEGKLESKKEYVFAEGEATNHFHAIKTKVKDDLKIVKLPNGLYAFELSDTAKITHPEHSMKVDLEVDKGYYFLYKGREKDWFSLATRKLID